MLEAKRFGQPVMPILNHGAAHGLLMLWVLYFLGVNHWLCVWLACFQVLSHTAIDVLKGRLNARYPVLQSPATGLHWCVFGADQYFHAAIIIMMWHFSGISK